MALIQSESIQIESTEKHSNGPGDIDSGAGGGEAVLNANEYSEGGEAIGADDA